MKWQPQLEQQYESPPKEFLKNAMFSWMLLGCFLGFGALGRILFVQVFTMLVLLSAVERAWLDGEGQK